MLTIALIVLGLFFITRLPVDLLPSITYPRIGLRVDAPGIAPEVAVDEITRPLEEALSATEGVEQVFSQTRDGRISIDLYFSPGGNIDQALNDATAALNRARDQIPETVETPRLFKFDPSQLPVYEFALTSASLDAVELRVFADEELARELTVVPGVASVDVSGGIEEEVLVKLDLNRLQALNIGLVDVLDDIDARNQDIAGGRIRGSQSESLTRTIGRFQNADEIRNLILNVDGSDDEENDSAPVTNASGTRQIKLRNVAEVVDGTAEQRIFVTLNQQPAVKVSVQKQPDANTISVVNAVKQQIDIMRQSGLVPDDVQMVITLDESIFIQDSIQNVAISGLTGAGLAAIAVLLFLGSLRQTFIIVLAIPLATLAAILMIWLFGLSLNVFTLGGLAIGVGIVVDNSIVMLENIAEGVTRILQQHKNGNGNGHHSRRSANVLIRQAEESSQEVESALVASTATNLVVVIPFLMIGGFISLLFNELILAVTFSIAASLLVALTVVPMLASRLLAIPRSSHIHRWGPLRWFQHHVERLTQTYARFLGQVLRYRVITILLAFLILGGSSVLLIGHVPQEILPRIDTGQARLSAQFPPGTPLADNRKVMAAIDELLLEQPEPEFAFTTAGGALFGSSTSENALSGRSTITLTQDADVSAFVDRMNQQFAQFNLVDTRIRMSPESVRGLILNNSPVRAEIDVGLQGPNRAKLEEAGRLVLAALDQATLAQYSPDAEEPQPEVQIRPNWERLADLELTTTDLGNTVQTALLGAVPTQLERSDRLVDVRVQLDRNRIERATQLNQLPLFADDNQLVRLADVATIDTGVAPGEIQRINQRQVYLIEGNLSEGTSLSEALEEVNQLLAEVELPEGVTRLPSYAEQSNREIQSALVVLGGLAAFLVFVVMAVQYNSLIDPLVIILTVPLALAGGILGLFVTQTAIGATVIVGAVLLVGIVVNNAIIMVELANQIRVQKQVGYRKAILLAAPRRLRPILMTTVTTVLGLFPLALGIGDGSEFLQPLGIVVFSGLSLATALTLIIIPCFYTLLHDLLEPKPKRRPPQQQSVPALSAEDDWIKRN
jgi:multidrug efflux pump subunit AcrB